MQQGFFAEKTVLCVCVVGTVLLQRSHEAAVFALPDTERYLVRELLRSQRLALGIFVLAIALELARLGAGLTSVVARGAAPAAGLVAAFVLFFVRHHAHSVFELAAEEHEVERVARARHLRRLATITFVASSFMWTCTLLYRVS